MNKILTIIKEFGYLTLLRRAAARIARLFNELFQFYKDSRRNTYLAESDSNTGSLNRIISQHFLLKNKNNLPSGIIKNYLSHRFDLLGSGWIKVFYGMLLYSVNY